MIDAVTRHVQTVEYAAFHSAVAKVVTRLGLEGASKRCELVQVVGSLSDRTLTLEIDGEPVWRGRWIAEGAYRARWSERWLVDLETIA